MEQGVQTIQDIIDKIIAGDNTAAQDSFDSVMAAKVTGALDTKRFELAQTVYDNSAEQEVSIEEVPVEDLEAALEEPEASDLDVEEEPSQDEQE